MSARPHSGTYIPPNPHLKSSNLSYHSQNPRSSPMRLTQSPATLLPMHSLTAHVITIQSLLTEARMPFSFSLLSRDSGITHLTAEGEATAVDFRPAGTHHFDTLLGDDWSSQRVLLNMERVPCIDSSAIGWLIHAQRAFRAAGGKLVLHSVSPAVRNVLELLKLGRIVPLAPSAHEGRALLLEPHPIPS